MASVAQPGAVEKDMQSRERRELMTSILQSLRNEEIASNEPAGALGSIPAQLSAFLWLADIDRLRAIEGEWRGHASKARLVLSGTLNQSRILSTWSTRRKSIPNVYSNPVTPQAQTPVKPSSPVCESPAQSSPKKRLKLNTASAASVSPAASSPVTPKFNRSKKTPEMIRRRDTKSVLTKATNPTVSAHLFPYSFNNLTKTARAEFWAVLEEYWNKEKVEKWRAFVKEKGTECPENQIQLCPNSHEYWDDQLCAFEPLSISDDKREMLLRFHWLCPENVARLTPSTADLPTNDPNFTLDAPSLQAQDPAKGRGRNDLTQPNIRLFNCETLEVISSGDVFAITTENPEALPLPSFEIFELQWCLHRVKAMAAAAGYRDEPEDDDDCTMGTDAVVISGSQEESEWNEQNPGMVPKLYGQNEFDGPNTFGESTNLYESIF